MNCGALWGFNWRRHQEMGSVTLHSFFIFIIYITIVFVQLQLDFADGGIWTADLWCQKVTLIHGNFFLTQESSHSFQAWCNPRPATTWKTCPPRGSTSCWPRTWSPPTACVGCRSRATTTWTSTNSWSTWQRCRPTGGDPWFSKTCEQHQQHQPLLYHLWRFNSTVKKN